MQLSQAGVGAVKARQAFVTVPLFSALLLPLVKVHHVSADYVVLASWLVAATAIAARQRAVVLRTSRGDRLGLIALAILGFAAAASAIDARAPGSLSVCFRFASYALVILLARLVRAEDLSGVRRLVYVAASALALSVYVQRLGLFHSLMPPYHDPEAVGARYGGLVGYPNFAAYALLACGLVALVDDELPASWKAVTIVIWLPAALSSGARTAFGMFIVCVVLAAVVANRRILLIAAPIVIVAVLVSGVVVQRIKFLEHSGGVTGNNAGGWRLIQWREDLSFHAWYAPLGVGWNRTKELSAGHTAAHSGYLQIVAELGLIGVVGFVLWLAYAAALGRRVGWRRSSSLLLFVAVCNVVDPVVLYPATTYVWLLLLLAIVQRNPTVTSPTPRHAPLVGQVHA